MSEHEHNSKQTQEESKANAEGVTQDHQQVESGAALRPPSLQLKAEEEGLVSADGIQRKTPTVLPKVLQRKQGIVQKSEAPTDSSGDVMSKMESSFGTSFSDVQIHQNSSKAQSVNALAYTQGNQIHFAPGQYQPDTCSGQELLGHELTHVVQQREGRVRPTTEINGLPVNDDKGLEAEADQLGAKAAQGKFIGTSSSKSSEGGALQMKQEVAQLLDVHGRFRFHDTGNDTPLGNARTNEDEHYNFMLRMNVPNYSISQWQAALADGDDNFTADLMGFLVFSMRPDLAGCDANTFAAFLEPMLNSSFTNIAGQQVYKAELESELEQRGLGESLIVGAFGGDVDTDLIENYWNRAEPPSDRQKEDFVVAMLSNSDDMELPENDIMDNLFRRSSYIALMERQIARPAFRMLVNQYYTRALVRISNDRALRSVAPSGAEFVAGYGNNSMRGKLMAESGATAMKALDVLVSNVGDEQKQNNAFNLIRQSGVSMQAILQAQSSADERAQGMVDTVFDAVWSLVPDGGALNPLKDMLKDALKDALHEMVEWDNMREKIQNFRSSFNRQAMNLVGQNGLTSQMANIASNALFSSSGGI